jgi:hypothetical protein
MVATKEVTREHLRTFHLTGRGLDEYRCHARLHPSILDGFTEVPPMEASYPVYAAPNQGSKPLAELVAGNSALVQAASAAMGERASTPSAEVRRALDESAIPEKGSLIGFHGDALPLLYGASVDFARGGLRADFFLRVKRHVARLQDILSVDDAHRVPASAERVAASLGSAGSQFLAASSLPGLLGRRGGTRSVMNADRRARCEATLKTLEAALREDASAPAFWLFHSGEVTANLDAFQGRAVQSADSCAEALDFCDQQLARFVKVLQAMRVARLEVDSAFDPAVHSELLDRFDWQSASHEELAALPVVAVLEPAERLAHASLTSFGRLLRSGRPVQVLVPCAGLYADDLSGVIPDFGFLAISHREAFVLQSSMAAWDHLGKGLATMAATLRPAVAVVAVPPAGANGAEAWREASLYYLSRTFPLYTYDPSHGTAWKGRLRLVEPDAGYASLQPLYVMALSAQFRDHFRVIPEAAWDQEQMEASEYFAQYESAPPLAVPYFDATDRAGGTQRVVFTREMANLSRDRHRAWQMFAELTVAHDKGPVVAPHPDEHAVQEAASQAYQRVLALLADPELLR